jgi:hypothetical protein
MFLEAAQAVAAAIANCSGTDENKAFWLFRRVLTRPPQLAERRLLLRFYHSQHARLTAGQLDAAKIAGPGEGDLLERAAWTLTARSLLNLDEAVSRE